MIHPIDYKDQEDHHALDFMRSCPSPNKLFPEKVRRPLRDLVTGVCPRISSSKRLRAFDFQASNADHLRTVYDMGITMVALGEGKVQLLHSFHNAKSAEDAERGLLFMQEMVELSKTQTSTPISQVQVILDYFFCVFFEIFKILFFQAVYFLSGHHFYEVLKAGPSHFSPQLTGENYLIQEAAIADPMRLCSGMF